MTCKLSFIFGSLLKLLHLY